MIVYIKWYDKKRFGLFWPYLELLIHGTIGTLGGVTVRSKVTLACTECKQRNYDTMKNKKNNPDRIEMQKYCKFCKTHTLHKETK